MILAACDIGKAPASDPSDDLRQHLIAVSAYGTFPRGGDTTRHLVIVADNPDPIIAHGVSDPTSVRRRGVHLKLTVTAGGGSVSPATLTTDAYGEARFDWVLGAAAGVDTVHVESDDHHFTTDYSVTANPPL